MDLTNFQYLYIPLEGEDYVYEPHITALLTYLAPKLNTFYDIGSNWGYYTLLLAADRQFQGNIHAFEIAPNTYRDLEHTVAAVATRSDINITCHQMGLSDCEGFLGVKHHTFSGMTMIVADSKNSGDALPVAALDTLELAPPDLMKIDVEGHEAAVLKGAQKILRRYCPTVILENHLDQNYERMLHPLRMLTDLGYLLFRPAWEWKLPSGTAYANKPQYARNRKEVLCFFQILPETRLLASGSPDIFAIHPSRLNELFPKDSN